MENVNNNKNEDYEYELITVFDDDGNGYEQSIDQILDDGLDHLSKQDKISYLNDIIRDVEHYRDNL